MPKLKPPFNKQTDHYKGNLNAPVQLLEYGDFQCPHCGAAHPMIKNIQEVFGSSLLFIFRHFPLSESHPYAQIAAIASEAAAKQERYWEMFDLIFENQNRLSRDMLLNLAANLKLDINEFQKSLSDPVLAAKVESDFESGILSGVNGTPSFYINSQKYNGPYTFEGLGRALEMANRTALGNV